MTHERSRRLACTLFLAVCAGTATLLMLPGPVFAQTDETASVEAASVEAAKAPAGPALDLSSAFPAWAQRDFMGVAVWQLLLAFGFILVGLVLKKISDYIFTTRLIPLFEKTRFDFDILIVRAASGPAGWLLALACLYGALSVLSLPTEPNVRGAVFGAFKLLLAADILWLLFRFVDVVAHYLKRLAGRTESQLDDQLIPLIRKSLKITIGIVCFVWTVQLLGYNVSSLLAGLGIGGLAIALALQDSLGNFFGSVFIIIDRPFAVGDWIKINDVEGMVEEIGFRSTRIRTWPKSLVTIPNKTVASTSIDNWSKMPKRRVVQTVGVTYETTAAQMEQAVDRIRNIVLGDEGVDKEFIVVRFTEFGESSLNILVYYFTVATAFADHLATKERINLAVMRAIGELGLSIAFPTRTVYFEGRVAESLAGHPAERGQDAPPKE
jgi:MscS family membrane protein